MDPKDADNLREVNLRYSQAVSQKGSFRSGLKSILALTRSDIEGAFHLDGLRKTARC
jgi:hypothetical protein